MLRNHDIAAARFAEQIKQALQILKSMNSWLGLVYGRPSQGKSVNPELTSSCL